LANELAASLRGFKATGSWKAFGGNPSYILQALVPLAVHYTKKFGGGYGVPAGVLNE